MSKRRFLTNCLGQSDPKWVWHIFKAGPILVLFLTWHREVFFYRVSGLNAIIASQELHPTELFTEKLIWVKNYCQSARKSEKQASTHMKKTLFINSHINHKCAANTATNMYRVQSQYNV